LIRGESSAAVVEGSIFKVQVWNGQIGCFPTIIIESEFFQSSDFQKMMQKIVLFWALNPLPASPDTGEEHQSGPGIGGDPGEGYKTAEIQEMLILLRCGLATYRSVEGHGDKAAVSLLPYYHYRIGDF
jgi:hypothetical protein